SGSGKSTTFQLLLRLYARRSFCGACTPALALPRVARTAPHGRRATPRRTANPLIDSRLVVVRCRYDIMPPFDSGLVTVDGVDVRALDTNWWRQQLAVVQQDPLLFSTTIRANIAYALRTVAARTPRLCASRARALARSCCCCAPARRGPAMERPM